MQGPDLHTSIRSSPSWRHPLVVVLLLLLGVGCGTTIDLPLPKGPVDEVEDTAEAQAHEFATYKRKLELLKTRWDQKPLDFGAQRQSFYDNAVIERSIGVRRHLGRVRKLNGGKPVLEATDGWESWEAPEAKTGLGAYVSVVRDSEGVFKAWYGCGKSTEGHNVDVGYAESSDGLTWKKRKGIVISPAHGHGVLYDTRDERADHRYKMAYGTGYFYPLFFAHSPNGIRWTPYGDREIIPEADQLRVDTQNGLFWDDELQAYRIQTRNREGRVRGIRQFIKPTFGGGWGRKTRAQVFGIQDEQLPESLSCYTFNAFKDGGIYIGMANLNMDTMRFRVATSRDGLSWDWRWVTGKDDLIPLGPPGSFDSSAIFCAATPFIKVGDEQWIYYVGMNRPYERTLEAPQHGSAEPHLKAIGVAALRLDGLFFIECSAITGMVETKPFVWQGDSLELNVDATLGELKVEVLDEAGKSIDGLDASTSDRFMSDEVHYRAAWSGSSDLARLKGTTVRLRFKMVGPVKLYAFQQLGVDTSGGQP